MREVAIFPLTAGAMVMEEAILLVRPGISIARAARSTTFASVLARGPAIATSHTASFLLLVRAPALAFVFSFPFALALALRRKSRTARGSGQTLFPIIVVLLLTITPHQTLHAVDEVLVGLLLVVIGRR